MWALLVAMSVASAVTTGDLEIRVEWADDNAWAHEVWDRAVRKLERKWRRESRRSDEPVPKPEPPERPMGVEDAIVVLESDLLIGGSRERLTDETGVVTEAVMPGIYTVTVAHSRAASGLTIEGVQVDIGRTKVVNVVLEEFSEVNVITGVGSQPNARLVVYR